ncbi:hypothetical protein V1502_07415 [Bacillus sp. SCS-153A]|uniref:hypothetical protein n=1 Tax=Rossellomorea sedimentorum TaxID=3115294 RepID=UPI003905B705
MMAGSLFWNFAFALSGFSLYFFLSFQTGSPRHVLTGSFLTGVSFFILMFVVRILIGKGMALDNAEENIAEDEKGVNSNNITETESAANAVYDERKIADAIRSMLKEE